MRGDFSGKQWIVCGNGNWRQPDVLVQETAGFGEKTRTVEFANHAKSVVEECNEG